MWHRDGASSTHQDIDRRVEDRETVAACSNHRWTQIFQNEQSRRLELDRDAYRILESIEWDRSFSWPTRRRQMNLFLFPIDSWLFTDAINVGIVQLIGKALRKRKLTKLNERTVAIGICNYGSVGNIQEFQRPEHRDSSRSRSEIEENIQVYNDKQQSNESMKSLIFI